MKWALPDQAGKLAIVTGANTGIGLATARALALAGADVILACRSRERGHAATLHINEQVPRGSAIAEVLDLADLHSIRSFAAGIRRRNRAIDLLINNAGVMIPPLGRTREGFELQIGVNHLGHFALTGLLLDSIRNTPDARIVTVSSIAHQTGRIDFNSFSFDSFGERNRYDAFREYRQSKLANLMFAIELDQRLQASEYQFRSLATHPGITRTDLVRHHRFFDLVARLIGMQAEQGALATLHAATHPDARGGGYYGPRGLREMRGYPGEARIMPRAVDPAIRGRLWRVSEELTGISFGI